MNIKNITNDVFTVDKVEARLYDIAFVSLRSALKAFYTTYNSLRYDAPWDIPLGWTQDKLDKQIPVEYIENCCQAITHFHHFVELIIKDVLRQHHALLAIDAGNQHQVLFDLLAGNEVDESKLTKTKSLEFSQSLERLLTLLAKKKISETDYGFFIKYDKFLRQLNYLRNRIVHRGLFVLRYTALDKLFAEYALPLLQHIITLERYKDQYFWKFYYLHLELNLLSEIINCAGIKYEPKKLAVLKEIGRAAYENPIRYRRKHEGKYVFFTREIVERSTALSNHILRTEISRVSDIKTCPVCGIDSLILFHEYMENEDEEGNYYPGDRYTSEIKCFCCTFELKSNIGSFDGMNLPIEDFWNSK